MLHQRRYFSWIRLPGQSMARTCLQYTMWLLAASCSRQFESICDLLYNETRQMLEILDTRDNEIDGIDIEQVQAWILLVMYEVTNTHSRRGWISAGRAFRLVQLMRLFEIDGSDTMLAQTLTEDWVQLEEKRRTFWMAYLLDRFISVQNGLPLTLNEQVVCCPHECCCLLHSNQCFFLVHRSLQDCLQGILSSKVSSVYK
jgi:Fungal specific transcription factor domain